MQMIWLAVYLGGAFSSSAMAVDNSAYAEIALKAANAVVADSARRRKGDGPLVVNTMVYRTRKFQLANLHDPAFKFWTGFMNAPLPQEEAAIVEVNAYSNDAPISDGEIAERGIFWRMVFGIKSSSYSAPAIFFSTGPFSGECGDPIIRVVPERLLRIDKHFLLELAQEQFHHGCAGQDETVRRVNHFFRIDDNFREVFQHESFFFNGSDSHTAMLAPVLIGDDSGGFLLLKSAAVSKMGKRHDTFDYLDWTKDGRLEIKKQKKL